MALAMSSLPVPLSPTIKLGASVRATLRTCSMSRRMLSLRPEQVPQAVLGQQLDVHALAGPHAQGGAAHAQRGAWREHGVVDAHGAHEGAVGGRVVAHHDALVAQLQLRVVARDGGVREHQPVPLGAPDGQLVGLGDEGDTLVGAVRDAHLDGSNGEPRAPFVIEFDCSLFCHDTAR
jgi:hypothetical protein